ncbi:Phosphodiesterase [Fasciola gigantica]|uniref:Phosphodiesterase n=1 Tax=Fasciola gigantica TaxID=46835 RepID=A0A504X762_FASGI|nr:Phosphodiesterase [Fasciola gigantica]
MFTDLNLPQLCHFPVEVLETWLLAVYRRYNDVPFHNFKHAFMVTQMMYAIIKQANLVSCLAPLDLLILLFSAISHDLDHPGYTNSYQVNRRSWLALRYNDVSPLENHHCAVAFDLISIPATNILVGLSQSEYLWFRKAVIRCILATDMATHRDCVDEFRAVLRKLLPTSSTVPALSENCTLIDGLRRGSLDRTEQLRVQLAEDPDSRIVVLFILLKTCDISNEVRPTPVADPWLDCLLDEFFAQARTEKFLGLPVLPHMDPDKVTRAGSQIGFIEFLLVPLLQDLCTLFPGLKSLENSAKERILHFELMERESKKSGTQQANPVPLDPSSSSKCLPSEPDAEVDSVQPVRTSSNATAFWLLPRLTDPVSHRGNKLRCLSTPVRPDLTSIAFQSSLDAPSQTTEPVVSRCKCRYSTDELPTGLHGSLLFSARDTVGSKRHHSQQQESVISALFQSDPAYSNKQQVKPDTEPLLSESVAVVAAAVAAAAAAAVASQTTPSTGAVPTVVSRRSSTGSMVAAII